MSTAAEGVPRALTVRRRDARTAAARFRPGRHRRERDPVAPTNRHRRDTACRSRRSRPGCAAATVTVARECNRLDSRRRPSRSATRIERASLRPPACAQSYYRLLWTRCWVCPYDCPCQPPKEGLQSQQQPNCSIEEVVETVG